MFPNLHIKEVHEHADLPTGVQGSDGLVPMSEPGEVMVPPPASPDQRLPIYDSLESDWFRRSGKTVTTARPSPGSGRTYRACWACRATTSTAS